MKFRPPLNFGRHNRGGNIFISSHCFWSGKIIYSPPISPQECTTGRSVSTTGWGWGHDCRWNDAFASPHSQGDNTSVYDDGQERDYRLTDRGCPPPMTPSPLWSWLSSRYNYWPAVWGENGERQGQARWSPGKEETQHGSSCPATVTLDLHWRLCISSGSHPRKWLVEDLGDRQDDHAEDDFKTGQEYSRQSASTCPSWIMWCAVNEDDCCTSSRIWRKWRLGAESQYLILRSVTWVVKM